MILIADSGGSKIDWRLLQRNGAIGQANTPGFNPYYQPIQDLKKSVEEVLLQMVHCPSHGIPCTASDDGRRLVAEHHERTLYDDGEPRR